MPSIIHNTGAVGLGLLLLLTSSSLCADDSPAAGSEQDDLFRTLDANGDGKITVDEVGEQQQRAFERLLRVSDENEDGSLTRKEFEAGFEPDDPVTLNEAGPGRPGMRGNRPQRPDIDQLFERVDTDGDGKIALKDLPEPLQMRLKALFDRLGKDELTREDFNRQRSPDAPRGQPRFDIGRLFERADTDGDGKLALDELPEQMQERLQPLFERLGKEALTREDFGQFGRMRQRARPAEGQRPSPRMREGDGQRRPQMALMRLLDADGNGLLSQEELQQIAEKFSELDRDGDGQLGPGELIGFGQGRMAGDRQRGRDGDSNRPRRPQRPGGDGDQPNRPRRPE